VSKDDLQKAVEALEEEVALQQSEIWATSIQGRPFRFNQL
jgi:hypothetical protein